MFWVLWTQSGWVLAVIVRDLGDAEDGAEISAKFHLNNNWVSLLSVGLKSDSQHSVLSNSLQAGVVQPDNILAVKSKVAFLDVLDHLEAKKKREKKVLENDPPQIPPPLQVGNFQHFFRFFFRLSLRSI